MRSHVCSARNERATTNTRHIHTGNTSTAGITPIQLEPNMAWREVRVACVQPPHQDPGVRKLATVVTPQPNSELLAPKPRAAETQQEIAEADTNSLLVSFAAQTDLARATNHVGRVLVCGG